MKKSIISHIQNHLLQQAIIVRDILERHNIPYMIIYGTLLGAVRHHGFIPWDDDIDFALFDNTYAEALHYLKSELPSHLAVENEECEPHFYHAWSRIKDLSTSHLFPSAEYALGGLTLDLFKLEKIKRKDEPEYRFREHICYLKKRHHYGLLSSNEFEKRVLRAEQQYSQQKNKSLTDFEAEEEIYTRPCVYNAYFYPDEIFPLTHYSFEGNLFLGPKNADNFLTRCYNDYMELPPIEKRQIHYNNVSSIEEWTIINSRK